MKTNLHLREVAHKAQGVPDAKLQELQELGQQHYRAQEYQDALRCFTEALDFGPRAPVSVLDNRAATYIKLDNLDAALNDGRRMIQKDKSNCTGYLRTGQILQLYNKQKMALDIYEMGTRKVPNTSTQCNKLKEVHNKLKSQLEQVNPVNILPIEIIEMIMKLLRFKEIVKLTRVSKSWHTLLVAMPSLWSDLDFVGARNPVKIRSIRIYIKRANGNVTRAALNKFGPNIEDVARCITSTCLALQELRMNAGYLSSSLLQDARCSISLKKLYLSSQCRITMETVSEIFRDCPNLETLEAHPVSSVPRQFHRPGWKSSLPHLHSLILRATSADTTCELDLTSLLAAIPSVRNLTIGNWYVPLKSPPPDFSTSHNLESLDISGVTMVYFPELPSSIHTLHMSKCRLQGHMLKWDASRLVRLTLAHPNGTRHNFLPQLLESNKGNLIYLDINSTPHEKSVYRWLANDGYLVKVEELNLNNCSNADDELATLIAENCTALKRLSLANTGVSGVGVKAIVTALEGKLEYLNLDGCIHTSYDAVEWARSKGVRVAFSLSEGGSGGKKIREG